MDMEIQPEVIGDGARFQNLLARMLVLEEQVADLVAWKRQVEPEWRLITCGAGDTDADKNWEPSSPNAGFADCDFEQTEVFCNQDKELEIFHCKVCDLCEGAAGVNKFENLEDLADHYTSVHSTPSILTLPDQHQLKPKRRKAKKKVMPMPTSMDRYPRNPEKKTKNQKAKAKSPTKTNEAESAGTSKVGFPCPVNCGRTFSCPHYSRDLVTASRNFRPATCEECSKDFLTKRSLDQHNRSRHQKSVRCSVCGLDVYRSRLKNHMLSHSGVDGARYASFSNPQTLHIQEQSRLKAEDRPFKCDQCEKTFKAQRTLQLHTLQHKETICEGCGTRFSDPTQLAEHRDDGRCQAPPKTAKYLPSSGQ